MSLILEALRKLEREKQAADRPGFVVLPASQWGEGRSRAGLLLAGLFVGAVLAALGIGLWMGASRTASLRDHGAQAPAATPQLAVDPLPAPAPPATQPGPAPTAAVTPALAVPPFMERPVSTPARTGMTPAPAPMTSAPVRPEPVVPATVEPEAAPFPTATPARPAAAGPALVLTAIGAREGRPVAVIDDRLVREGDEYDGWRVLSIGADSVEVLYKGERRVLRFQ